MGVRFLTILEVSQKQAYIFSSNKLKDNVTNSAVIAWVMDADYFEKVISDESKFSKEKNLVYSGGGHTILEFETKEKAWEFTKKITTRIHEEYKGIEVFAATMEYEENCSAGENIKKLTEKLEKKKSLRKSAFHQGSFGIEKINTNTLKPMYKGEDEEKESKKPAKEEKIDKELFPEGYIRASEFKELGGSKNESNFIAVVHIDGNAMGKRVSNLYENNKTADWDTYKRKLANFSQSVDDDFKSAYKSMTEIVKDNIEKEKLKDLSIKDKNFPVRRIITAGDDICFVTEGRIGLECAVAFIKELNKCQNKEDKEGYAACAGVAIVHQKYPFYKAYELSELLCSNAKKYAASLSEDKSGKEISVIDWHIEFGEIKDTLKEIRKGYETKDGQQLEGRPYLVSGSSKNMPVEDIHRYENFKKQITYIMKDESCARGKLKEMREVMKQGQDELKYYLDFNRMQDMAFDKITLFDAVEMIDTFLELDY